MLGVDVSEHDNNRAGGRRLGVDWFAQWEYAIIRSHNENGFADQWVLANLEDVQRAGIPWGIYAWPVVGWGHDRNRAHVAQIVDTYGRPPLGVAADAEHSGRGFAAPDEVEGFARGALDRGAGCLYYCAIGELWRTPLLDAVPWWVADYGPNDGRYHDPNEQPPRPPADRPWVIHQFTSLGAPGGSPLDVNYAASLDFAGVIPQEDDDMKATIVQKRGEPYLYVFVNGVKFPSTSKLHVDLMAFNEQTRNGSGDPVVLSPEEFDAIPNADDAAPAPCPPGLGDASNDELVAELDRRLS